MTNSTGIEENFAQNGPLNFPKIYEDVDFSVRISIDLKELTSKETAQVVDGTGGGTRYTTIKFESPSLIFTNLSSEAKDFWFYTSIYEDKDHEIFQRHHNRRSPSIPPGKSWRGTFGMISDRLHLEVLEEIQMIDPETNNYLVREFPRLNVGEFTGPELRRRRIRRWRFPLYFAAALVLAIVWMIVR